MALPASAKAFIDRPPPMSLSPKAALGSTTFALLVTGNSLTYNLIGINGGFSNSVPFNARNFRFPQPTVITTEVRYSIMRSRARGNILPTFLHGVNPLLDTEIEMDIREFNRVAKTRLGAVVGENKVIDL